MNSYGNSVLNRAKNTSENTDEWYTPYNLDTGAEFSVSLYGYFSGQEVLSPKILNSDIVSWDFLSVGSGLCLNYCEEKQNED